MTWDDVAEPGNNDAVELDTAVRDVEGTVRGAELPCGVDGWVPAPDVGLAGCPVDDDDDDDEGEGDGDGDDVGDGDDTGVEAVSVDERDAGVVATVDDDCVGVGVVTTLDFAWGVGRNSR